jgi:bifunctional enzyme CysN/CysC
VTGASTADLAVLLVDARQGILTQTRRHAYLVHLLGIKHIVLAVNKMDLVDFDQMRFDEIVADFTHFAATLEMTPPLAIPISGLAGDNITEKSVNTPWYAGPALLPHLETVELAEDAAQQAPFAMPVQWVNRPNLDFRGFSGRLAGGTVKPGDKVRIVPSGKTSTIASIVTMAADASQCDLAEAVAGQSVTLTLKDEIDCSRGDVIAAADNPPLAADRFEASLVWMDETEMLPGRAYELRIGTQAVSARIQAPKYAVNVNNMEHLAAASLGLNEIGVVELATDRPVVFAPFADSQKLGSFVLIDKLTNATVAAGMLHFSLRRAHNIHWQAVDVDRAAHAALKDQQPKILWFTGLSGSGKSTIANALEKKLHANGKHTFLLDGDNVRHGLNKDLGFTDADRIENIRRIGEVAKLMTDAGLIVLTAFISPFRAERDMVRALVPAGDFIEVHVDTPLDVAERRDVKGLYKKARAGTLKNFTGIDSPYEPPETPEIVVNTTELSADEAADVIIAYLDKH